MNDLTGKTALVTGSSRGIGRAAALKLAQLGARVIFHGTTPGEKLLSAYAAVPQSASALTLRIAGNAVALPELKDDMIVILRYGKK